MPSIRSKRRISSNDIAMSSKKAVFWNQRIDVDLRACDDRRSGEERVPGTYYFIS
jgi:hypothetical protein